MQVGKNAYLRCCSLARPCGGNHVELRMLRIRLALLQKDNSPEQENMGCEPAFRAMPLAPCRFAETARNLCAALVAFSACFAAFPRAALSRLHRSRPWMSLVLPHLLRCPFAISVAASCRTAA